MQYLTTFSVLLLFAMLLQVQTTTGQTASKKVLPLKTIKKEKFNLYPEGENSVGYTQAVKVGTTVYISGAVGTGDMENAIKEVYRELKTTLEHYHLTFRHVVKENVFTTDIEAFKKAGAVRKSYYPNNDFPAATWVQVQRLYSPEHVLEVELIADTAID